MSSDLTPGEYVRRLRRQKGWGLEEFATATQLSISHLSRIENDKALPNAETVVKLAKALDGQLERMLEMADCLPGEILDRLLRRVEDEKPELPGAFRAAGLRERLGAGDAGQVETLNDC